MQADNYQWTQAKLAISEGRLDYAKRLLDELVFKEGQASDIEHALAFV